jgi:hypothetical protein
MPLFVRLFSTRTLMQIAVVLTTAVAMKARNARSRQGG